MKDLLECKLCPDCGKVPILVVHKPLAVYYLATGKQIKVIEVEACDECFVKNHMFHGCNDGQR